MVDILIYNYTLQGAPATVNSISSKVQHHDSPNKMLKMLFQVVCGNGSDAWELIILVQLIA